MCIITKNVSLLPWVVCVSGISSYFDDGSWTSIAAFLLLRHALMKHSEVELWTAEMSFQYNVRLLNNIRLWIFCYWMNSFVKTFLLFTKRDVIASTVTDGTFLVIHPSSSSFITWSTKTHHLFIHPAKDFYIKTTAEVCVVNNNILSQLRETVQHYELHYEQSTNYNTVTVTTRYDMWLPTSPKNVTTFLSSAENWNFFFITNTYPTCIFYHFKTLPKLLLPTSIYLPSK